jgi:hypothetical protein
MPNDQTTGLEPLIEALRQDDPDFDAWMRLCRDGWDALRPGERLRLYQRGLIQVEARLV